MATGIKILFLDIEVSPNTVHCWGLWQQNVAMNQILESSYTLCWSAKWQHEKRVMFDSIYKSRPSSMIKRIHQLMSEADAIVHYHGSSFDVPTLNKDFLLYNLAPPPPSKEMDLLKVVRKRFRFPSNRLDYVAQRLKLGKKYEHEGHGLWIKCMQRDPVAWKTMETYNRQDVVLLEKLYNKVLPWIRHHANHGLFNGTPDMCPSCGSKKTQRRGYAFTHAGKYQRYQCRSCASWFRGTKNIKRNSERFVTI